FSSADHSRRPVPRLTERVPSLENGDIVIEADGKMRVRYVLRGDVTWQDGVAFTADDLAFTFQVSSDPGIPFGLKNFIRLIDSVEAPDDRTFQITFAAPYYKADRLGLESYWPLPRHILGPAFDAYLSSHDADALMNLPYWTSEYVNLGPFAVATFDPADTITLRADDGYFLGRPKLDTIYLKVFSDTNSLFANLLAGQVDMFF